MGEGGVDGVGFRLLLTVSTVCSKIAVNAAKSVVSRLSRFLAKTVKSGRRGIVDPADQQDRLGPTWRRRKFWSKVAERVTVDPIF